MSDFLSHFGFPLLALLGGMAILFVAYRQSKKRVSAGDRRRSLLDYILVWPILFEKSSAHDNVSRSERLLTARELVGWLIVVVLMAVALAIGIASHR
jgi:hypothetical protein